MSPRTSVQLAGELKPVAYDSRLLFPPRDRNPGPAALICTGSFNWASHFTVAWGRVGEKEESVQRRDVIYQNTDLSNGSSNDDNKDINVNRSR